jgi:hypothetical protein
MNKMKPLLLIFIISSTIYSCDFDYCDDNVKYYRQAEFSFKIEKKDGHYTRNITIEGKDKDGIYRKWKDRSIWLRTPMIEVGDSIYKEKGSACLLLRKPNVDTLVRICYKCKKQTYE